MTFFQSNWKIVIAGRLVGRYYRPQYRPPSKCPSDYCTYKITRLLDSIELAKNFIEEARTVEKIKIRWYLAVLWGCGRYFTKPHWPAWLSASPSPSPSCPTRPAHPSTRPSQGCTWSVLVRIISITLLLSAHPSSHLLPSNIPQQFLPAHLLRLPNTPSLTFVTWWTSYTLSFLRLIHHNVQVIVGMGHSLL